MNKTQKDKVDKKPQKRRTEVLTESDIKNLMGMNRATYSRGRGGAIRQK